MNILARSIKKNIDEHIKTLNSESYSHYRDSIDADADKDVLTSDLIADCDWDSDDFNVGFEQGYLSGMKSVQSEVNAFNGVVLSLKQVESLKELLDFAIDHAEDVYSDDDDTWAESWESLDKAVAVINKAIK